MDTSKIKIKIGPHEFEAEGPSEIVASQFAAFKELIAAVPATAPAVQTDDDTETPAKPSDSSTKFHVPLEKIMKADGRVVSLTASTQSAEDAALLILLGQKDLRGKESATGQEIGDGLEQSGRPVSRVDRLMDKSVAENSVMKIGLGRATRYRLTNPGVQKALAIARELIAHVA